MVREIVDSVIGYFLALEVLCLKVPIFGKICHMVTCLFLIFVVCAIFIPTKTTVNK